MVELDLHLAITAFSGEGPQELHRLNKKTYKWNLVDIDKFNNSQESKILSKLSEMVTH